jgi:hypothetical protein
MLEGTDSNRRTRKGADLQSAGFNHSPTFQGCGVDGVRTTWHKFFQDSALPWEYHMSTPPELLHLVVQRVGLEPTRLTTSVPKTDAATVTPPLQLYSPTFQRSFVFQHHKDMANF